MYYFVSTKNFDGKILSPRIPVNRMNNEDECTKRICVSQSIDGCLVATYYEVGEMVYVHSCESNSVVSPSTIQVEDSPFTGEQWITKPVLVTLFIKLKITERIKRTASVDSRMAIDTYCYEVLC